MTTTVSEHRPIDILEGVEPSTDNTSFATKHWVSSDKVRFVNGKPRKIKGWSSIDFDNSATISGMCRSIYSALLNNKVYTLYGTHQKLYNTIGTELINITPLSTSTTTIADSLATHYATLGSDPIATTSGSADIVVTDSEASKFQEGDSYVLSGATTTNGILDTEINTTHTIRDISGTSITLTTAGSATSTGSGGGASVVRTSGLVTVTAASHGQSNGDRVSMTGAADFGGITASTQFNIEHIIRNVAAGTFDVMTAGTATSSVSSAGGSSTAYAVEIGDGAADETFGQGYGLGKYGVGLYGVSKTATTARTYPRMWFWDRFGDVFIGTPGNQTGLYSWDGDTSASPVLVTNAPTAINYAFVTDNIVVTLGSGGVENRVKTSDQNGLTTWTGTAENQVFEDDIEGAGRFHTHLNVKGTNLIFTEDQTYTMRKIEIEAGVFEIKPLDTSIGCIAPMARITVNGIGFWMGLYNFYMWRGGNVEVIPSNSGPRSTLINYVFNNINRSQKSKCFVEYVEQFNELRFHYPSAGSNDPDRVACVNLQSFAWWPDTIDRTACEYPNQPLSTYRMADDSSVIYYHEQGNDDDDSAMTFTLKSPRRYSGKEKILVSGIIPDSVQVGSLTVDLDTYQYPQSGTAISSQSATVSPTTEFIPLAKAARYWDWEITGSASGQSWIMGDWMDEIQRSSPQ